MILGPKTVRHAGERRRKEVFRDRRSGFRKAHRAIQFALVPRADMTSLGTAEAVLQRIVTDRTDL
jgi:hypothetical protein